MSTFLKVIVSGVAAFAMATSAGAFAQNIPAADSFYQDLGGKEGIQKIVDTFIPIVLEDLRINYTFDGVDMKRLANKLFEQFCELSGGPCKYTGKDMVTIHEDLKITNAQFNALAENLQTAMDKQSIPSRVQNKLIAKLAPMQRDIVTK
jgi:hemoglobin